MSDSLQLHRLQLARLLCPSLSLEISSNSCPLSRWCYLTISSSATLFSFCFQSSPASRPFPMICLFTSHGKVLELQFQHQSFQWVVRVDFLQNWVVGSLCSPRNSQSLLQHHSSKPSILWLSAFFMVQLSHPYMTTGKTTALTKWAFVSKVMSLLFNTQSRFVI